MRSPLLCLAIFTTATGCLTACQPQQVPQSQQATQSQQAIQISPTFNPDVCTFNYFTNDNLSQTLASNASTECLATQGQIGPAYQRWRDYFYGEQSRRENLRNALISGAMSQ